LFTADDQQGNTSEQSWFFQGRRQGCEEMLSMKQGERTKEIGKSKGKGENGDGQVCRRGGLWVGHWVKSRLRIEQRLKSNRAQQQQTKCVTLCP